METTEFISTIRRCIGYSKNGKKCRAIINGNREDNFFCCDAHRPYNMDLFDTGCCICSTMEYGKGEVKMFRFGHVVHKKCYDEWLQHSTYESRICFICRYEIDKKNEVQEDMDGIRWIKTKKGVKVPSKKRNGNVTLDLIESFKSKAI
jgi:hypothetical protein